MSEKFYALLLRLYPAQFREDYGEEALRLFRDRFEDERGFLPRLRLWFDLICDLTVSIPREYLRPASPRAAARTSAVYPGLYVIELEPLRFSALLSGGVVTVFAVGIVYAALISQAQAIGAKKYSGGLAGDGNKPGIHERARLNSDSGSRAGASAGALSSGTDTSANANLEGAPKNANAVVAKGARLDDAERQRVIAAASIELRKHYVNRDAAPLIADALLMHERRGDYDNVTDAVAFAGLVTRQMREISADQHLSLDYFDEPFAEQQPRTPAEEMAQYRTLMKQQNCTFEKVEILPGNTGYLKINSFPDVAVCEGKAVAAMKTLNHADAVIFDLRDNRGGEPKMVQRMAAYLFDHPEYWYNPRENTTERSWTKSPVPGNLLADKPVYILTSSQTFSGAEQFCYDLKMLKRATLIGETTAGASHAGVFHRIDDHFGIGIPEVKAINPYSENDWTGVGVEPDVKVKSSDALGTAEKLALAKLFRPGA
ncbi:MAG TPA: S41 family peptidase [Candidatus Acidoferrum sp.]|nr:S41 family peptidase [Candidatus Acidoferrum sp.]